MNGDGSRRGPSGNWGVRKRCLDAPFVRSTPRDTAAPGGPPVSPHFAQGLRAVLQARFGIPPHGNAGKRIPVCVARPRIRMRQWFHERTRMVLPHRPARPKRARRTRRPSPRRRRVRWPGGVQAGWLLEPLRFPAPGGRPVPGVRLLPAGGRSDGPALSRGRGADSRWTALHHDGERARQGHDRGEPGGSSPSVLRPFAPGGEATGCDAAAGGAGAEEDDRHRDPASTSRSRRSSCPC